jgi:hypothetical protein
MVSNILQRSERGRCVYSFFWFFFLCLKHVLYSVLRYFPSWFMFSTFYLPLPPNFSPKAVRAFCSEVRTQTQERMVDFVPHPPSQWSGRGFILSDRLVPISRIRPSAACSSLDDGGSKNFWNVGKIQLQGAVSQNKVIFSFILSVFGFPKPLQAKFTEVPKVVV